MTVGKDTTTFLEEFKPLQEVIPVQKVQSWIDKIDTAMLIDYAIRYGVALVGAVLIFFLGRWGAGALTRLAQALMTRRQVDPTVVTFLGNILYFLLLAIVVIAAISTLGVPTASLTAMIAAAGLAVGLALQGSLSNFASGVLIITFRPFRIGDYIETGTQTGGTVESVNMFTTHLTTPDNCAVVVPNNMITTNIIKNFSAKTNRRLDLVVNVSYSDDLNKAKQVLEDVLKNSPYVLPEPAPVVAVLELAQSSVNFAVRPWVKNSEYWNAHFEITKCIKEKLEEAGITIPYPQQVVHHISDKPAN
jgi:small conductance mechanosensitive channel